MAIFKEMGNELAEIRDVARQLGELGRTFERVGNEEIGYELGRYEMTLLEAVTAIDKILTDNLLKDLDAAKANAGSILKTLLNVADKG